MDGPEGVQEDKTPKPDSLSELSIQAEIFHQMLMEDFRFMEAARQNSGEYESANLSTKDLKPISNIKELMVTNPQGLVNFAEYGEKGKIMTELRKKNKVTNDFRTRRFATRISKWPALNIFAHWLLSTRFFSGLMITVIVLNSLLMAVDGELSEDTDKNIRHTIDALDFVFLTMFVAEIALKFIDNFREFWQEAWNIFDFIVTAMSLVAPILDIVTYYLGDDERLEYIIQIVKYIRILRILRSLNVVTRIRKILVIWEAITRTAKSLAFITILMFIFFYIYAIIGIQLFDKFTKSHRDDLSDHEAFKNLGLAMITLFRLFTLDKWYDIVSTLGDGMGGMLIPCIYGLTWILLGAFIFNNIFVGVIANNFQSIRKEVQEEASEMAETSKLASDLNIFGLKADENNDPDRLVDWETNVNHNLDIINACSNDISPTMWPRDTLFRYYIILQSAANNLDERNKIAALLNHALLRNYEG